MKDYPAVSYRTSFVIGGLTIILVGVVLLVGPLSLEARRDVSLALLVGALGLGSGYGAFRRLSAESSYYVLAPLAVGVNTLAVGLLRPHLPESHLIYLIAIVGGTITWGTRRGLSLAIASGLGFGLVVYLQRASAPRLLTETAFVTGMLVLVTALVGYLVEEQRRSRAQETSARLALDKERLASSLSRVGMALSSSLDLADVLDLVCRESVGLFRVQGAYIWLREGAELVGAAGRGPARELFLSLRFPVDHPQLLGARVLASRRPAFRNRVREEEAPDIHPELRERMGIRSILGVPLVRGEEPLGTLVLVDTEDPERFAEGDMEIAQTLGAQAALAIQNARLYEETVRYAAELQSHTQHLSALTHIATMIGGSLDLKHILQTTADVMADVMAVSQTGIALLDEEGRGLELVAEHIPPGTPRGIGLRIPVRGNQSMQRVMESKRPLAIGDAETDPLLESIRGLVRQRGFKSLLIVPLIVRAQVVGTIGLDGMQPRVWRHEEIELAQAIANQVAAALENARLYEEKQSQLARLAALYRASQILNQHLELNPILSAILLETLRLVQARLGSVVLVDPSSQTLRIEVSEGLEAEDVRAFNEAGLPVQTGTFALSIAGGQIVEIQEAHDDPRVARLPGLIPGRLLNVPLRTEAETLGAIALTGVEAPTDEASRSLLEAMADIAAVAIQRASLYEQARRRAQELSALYETSQAISSTLELRDVLETIARQARDLLKTDASRIYLLRREVEELEPLVALEDQAELVLATTLKLGEGISGWVARSGVGEVVNDAHLDPRGKHIPGTPVEADNLLAVPLVVGDEILGVMTLSRYGQGRRFSEGDLRFATSLAAQAALAIRNAQLYDETVQLAIADPLTGVYNRRYLLRELEREIVRSRRYERPFSILFLDVDALKSYNDRYGHLVGDALLLRVAEILRANLRDSDIVARYAGDEFMVVLPETGREGGTTLMGKLRGLLRDQPLEVGPDVPPERIAVSFGLAVFPEDGETAEELIEQADRAMYRLKPTGYPSTSSTSSTSTG